MMEREMNKTRTILVAKVVSITKDHCFGKDIHEIPWLDDKRLLQTTTITFWSFGVFFTRSCTNLSGKLQDATDIPIDSGTSAVYTRKPGSGFEANCYLTALRNS